MKRTATVPDENQPLLFDVLPSGPWRSDERARADMLRIVEQLEAAKEHPWSALLLGWQLRTFATLAQRLTPVEAAALEARLNSELERLGPPAD